MCAIFGIGFLTGYSFNNNGMIKLLINQLFRSSQARGRTSSGIAITTEQETTVLKKKQSGSDFVNDDEYIDLINSKIKLHESPRLISIIGHCRLPTKGSADIYENNHPIVSGHIVGIHNGCISNDESIWSTFTKQQEFARRGQVDSEIIFKLLDYYSNEQSNKLSLAIQKTSKAITGSYACAAVNTKVPWTIWLFKNVCPTYVYYINTMGIIIFSTDKDYIKEAMVVSGLSTYGHNLDNAENIVYPNHSGMSINLYNHKLYTFTIDKSDYYHHLD